MNEVDFTDLPRLPGKAYNGANGKKIAVDWQGACWMLKFPPSAADKPNDLSYSNSCLSEHLASTIFRMLGLDAQETRLGTFRNGRTKVVCACRDFTAGGRTLLDFCSIKNTVIDSASNGTGTELSDILETIDRQQFVEPVGLRRFFWDMFIADAFLGNFDRHNGNWGFLVGPDGRTEIAPVFDCGSCLLPQADETVMRKVLSDVRELDARVFTFPASMIKRNGVKINYAEFIRTSGEPDLKEALGRILPRIDLGAIAAFIAETPYLSDLQREFYVHYIRARYEKLFRL